jgi:hypothetical protein
MNFIVALQAEARPLIDKFKLQKSTKFKTFRIFHNTKHRLIVSGIGQVQAAAATGFLLGLLKDKAEALLNVGLAGHGKFATGTPFLANRIENKVEDSVYFPPPVLKLATDYSLLQTVDSPEYKYPKAIGYDMEAHAIYNVACKSITREMIQVLKIVSDNPSHPLEQFDAEKAVKLISDQIPLIEEISKQMESLSNEITVDQSLQTLVEEIQSMHRFTQTETHQIERDIQRATCLGLEANDIIALARSSANGKSTISSLRREIKKIGILS